MVDEFETTEFIQNHQEHPDLNRDERGIDQSRLNFEANKQDF